MPCQITSYVETLTSSTTGSRSGLVTGKVVYKSFAIVKIDDTAPLAVALEIVVRDDSSFSKCTKFLKCLTESVSL